MHTLFICSDSVGGTAETVAEATIRQFDAAQVRIKKYSHVQHEEEIAQILREVREQGGFIAYTLVQPELREMMRAESIKLGVRAVDIMGPMMQAFIDTYGDVPKAKPGLLHEMDSQYFRRMEAIEFAVKYDDGRDAGGLLKAQLILLGVSRTSKTPLSIYLAHKGIKVANLPIIPEVKLPDELFMKRVPRIVGLTMEAESLLNIRTERLRSMGLPPNVNYVRMERIRQELDCAHEVMKRLNCPIIDVTNKAIEETAGMVLEWL